MRIWTTKSLAVKFRTMPSRLSSLFSSETARLRACTASVPGSRGNLVVSNGRVRIDNENAPSVSGLTYYAGPRSAVLDYCSALSSVRCETFQ